MNLSYKSIIADLHAATALLTRIPVLWSKADFNPTAYWSFGVIGVVVAALPAFIGAVLLSLGAPALAVAALMLGGVALISGGLHHDGLADIADSFGAEKDQRLAVMHDSNIGAFGVLALIMVSLISVASLASLGEGMIPALLAVAVLSRSLMALNRFIYEPPEAKGLAHTTGKPDMPIAVISLGIGAVLAIIFVGNIAVALLAVGALVTVALGWFLRLWVGGVGGDGLGATQQLSEAAMLLTLAILVN